MRRLLNAFGLVFGLVLTAGAEQASACSIGYKKGYSPQDIKRRFDVRKVEGTFTLTEITGERFTDEKGDQMVRNAMLLGQIRNASGRIWKTIQPPPDAILIEMCGCDCWYHRPEGNATGTFWIARKAKVDRLELLLWEGDYLPNAEPAKVKD